MWVFTTLLCQQKPEWSDSYTGKKLLCCWSLFCPGNCYKPCHQKPFSAIMNCVSRGERSPVCLYQPRFEVCTNPEHNLQQVQQTYLSICPNWSVWMVLLPSSRTTHIQVWHVPGWLWAIERRRLAKGRARLQSGMDGWTGRGCDVCVCCGEGRGEDSLLYIIIQLWLRYLTFYFVPCYCHCKNLKWKGCIISFLLGIIVKKQETGAVLF